MTQTVLITGASKGIGLALSKLFLANSYKVIGTCRTGIIEDFKHDFFDVVKQDLSDLSSLESVSEYVKGKYGKIDILINNAGIGPDLDTDRPEKESFQKTFDVNVTGAVFFTESMIDKINKGGMIINISSILGSIESRKTADSVAYCMSKSALNMYSKILFNRLKGSHKIASIHPGWVRTTIAPSNITEGKLSPEESAANIFDFITSDFKSGIYWNAETGSEIKW